MQFHMLLLWGDGFLWFLSTSNALAVSLLKKRYGVWVVTNGMYGCHMLSRFRDLLKWKRNHIFKKQRISGERWKKKNRRNSVFSYFLLFIFHYYYYYYIASFFLLLLEKHQHVISGCHYSHHDMVNSSYTNAFDNKNYSGWQTFHPFIHNIFCLPAFGWNKNNIKWNKTKFECLSIKTFLRSDSENQTINKSADFTF